MPKTIPSPEPIQAPQEGAFLTTEQAREEAIATLKRLHDTLGEQDRQQGGPELRGLFAHALNLFDAFVMPTEG